MEFMDTAPRFETPASIPCVVLAPAVFPRADYWTRRSIPTAAGRGGRKICSSRAQSLANRPTSRRSEVGDGRRACWPRTQAGQATATTRPLRLTNLIVNFRAASAEVTHVSQPLSHRDRSHGRGLDRKHGVARASTATILISAQVIARASPREIGSVARVLRAAFRGRGETCRRGSRCCHVTTRPLSAVRPFVFRTQRLEKCVHTRGVRATASLGQPWEQLSSGRSQEITHAVFLYGSQAVASCDVALHKS